MTEGLYPVAILAGGLATRLQPLTTTVPKSLVDVNGEPFIAHQLHLLRASGATRVVVCAGYLGEMIQEQVGDGAAFGLRIDFSFDGPRLLGTAGALKRALGLLGDAFLVLYGDSYLPCDYLAVQTAFSASGKLALMTVYQNEDHWDRSNVEFAGGRIIAYDKRHRTPRMRHVDYGLGVLSRGAFESVPDETPHDLETLYQSLLTRGKLAAWEAPHRFYEIGSFEGLEETRRYLASDAVPRNRPDDGAMTFSQDYLAEAHRVIDALDADAIERVVDLLADTRERQARLFILGVGGSAANASHAVNDFRKIAGLEAYAPTDNVSELTARINDDGWASVFEGWLRVSRLRAGDLVLVFSVGGGDAEKNVSPNLVAALQFAKTVGARIAGVVGRDGGYTARVADACVIIPTVNPEHVTPHTEAFQAVVWHLLVTHPRLKAAPTKWESVR